MAQDGELPAIPRGMFDGYDIPVVIHVLSGAQDFKNTLATNPIQGFDVAHQLWRLRLAKRMSDGEAELIMRTIADNLQTYDQVTEVCMLRRGS